MQVVHDPAGLGEVLDVLHGRWFSSEDVVVDPHEGTLIVGLARRSSEEPPFLDRSLGPLFRRWRVPLRETVLRIRNVADHAIERGDWRLEAVGYDGGIVSLIAEEVPVVRAAVASLRIEVEETPQVVGERIESCTLGFIRRYHVRRTQ